MTENTNEEPLSNITSSSEEPQELRIPKKKWSEYLLEFFMLFLAVFLGFFAENYRDTLTEHQKEKQFIISYIDDLKVDTTSIHNNLIFQESKRTQLDSMTYMLREQKIKGNENELYYFGRLLVRTQRFQNSDRTISQLKYSGSMRLIRNEEAADSIIAYQRLVEVILTNVEDERVERRNVGPLLASIFSPYVFDKMLDENNNIIKPINYPPLRSNDPSLHEDLAYHINLLKGSNIILTTRLKLLLEKANNIISFLRKEYNIKE